MHFTKVLAAATLAASTAEAAPRGSSFRRWLERTAAGQSHADRETLRYHGQKREEDIRHETHQRNTADGDAIVQAPNNGTAPMSEDEKMRFAHKLAGLPVVGSKYGAKDEDVVVDCPTAASVVVKTETEEVTVYVTEIPPTSTPDGEEPCDEDGNPIDEDGDKIDEHGNKIDEDGDKVDKNGDKIDEDGKKTDKEGNNTDEDCFDEDGNLIDEDGNLIDEDGNLIDEDGHKVDEEEDAKDDDDDTLTIGVDDFGNTTTDCDEDESSTATIPGTTKSSEIVSTITSNGTSTPTTVATVVSTDSAETTVTDEDDDEKTTKVIVPTTSRPKDEDLTVVTKSSKPPAKSSTTPAPKPVDTTTGCIDTSIVPITTGKLTVTVAAPEDPTRTVIIEDHETGVPESEVAYCGVKGKPAGVYFIAEFIEERSTVPVTEEGCYQFCTSVMESTDGCQSYRFYHNELGAPRCALYGAPVASVVDDLDEKQDDMWFDLACGSPKDGAWQTVVAEEPKPTTTPKSKSAKTPKPKPTTTSESKPDYKPEPTSETTAVPTTKDDPKVVKPEPTKKEPKVEPKPTEKPEVEKPKDEGDDIEPVNDDGNQVVNKDENKVTNDDDNTNTSTNTNNNTNDNKNQVNIDINNVNNNKQGSQ